MSGLMGSTFSNATDISSDKVIAFNASSGAAASAQVYLSAALASTTPEVRRLFSEYMTQSMMGHEMLMALMVKNNWAMPYETPENQLNMAVKQAQPVVQNMQQ